MSAILDPRAALIAQHVKRAGLALLGVVAIGLVPFVPPSAVWLSILGLAAGVYAAWAVLTARALSKVERVGARYQQAVIPDCTFTDQTLVGYGMEFAQYREAFDRVVAEKGRLSPEEHKALHHELVQKMIPIYIKDADLTRHMLVMASTGLGKTELFQAMILPSVIKRGGGCLMFDAKGDEKLITAIYAMAREFHREEDVIFVNLKHPEYSHTYNPLLASGTRQIVSTLMKLFDKRGEQFFRDFARAALTAAIVCIKGQPRPVAFNFMDLSVLFSDYFAFEGLYHKMPDGHEDKPIVWSFLQKFHGVDRDGNKVINTLRYTEMLTGLANKMLDFSHSEYKRVLNDYSPDLDLKSAILGNKIIVVVIPALQDKEGVESFGKLFLGDFARAIGEIQEDRQKPSPTFFAFLDEFGSFADPSQAEIFAQARSANIALVPSVQAYGMLAKVEPYFADNIAANCWHHVYFDVRDPNTREYVSRLAGKTVRRYRTESTSESFGMSHENVQTGARRMESKGKSVSRSAREANEDLISPNDFAMDEGNAILVAKSGTYRMVTPLVKFEQEPPRLNEIVLARFDKLQVPGLNLMQANTFHE